MSRLMDNKGFEKIKYTFLIYRSIFFIIFNILHILAIKYRANQTSLNGIYGMYFQKYPRGAFYFYLLKK